MNASDTTSAAGSAGSTAGSTADEQEHTTPQPADQAAQDRADQPASDQAASDQTASDQTASEHGAYDYRQNDVPLYRPYEGRMVAGVAAGIAQYLGVDPTIVRIVLAVLTVVGGAGIPVYVAGWLLMPDEGASQSLASEFIGSLQGRSW